MTASGAWVVALKVVREAVETTVVAMVVVLMVEEGGATKEVERVAAGELRTVVEVAAVQRVAVRARAAVVVAATVAAMAEAPPMAAPMAVQMAV